jgi:hypothetical protein
MQIIDSDIFIDFLRNDKKAVNWLPKQNTDSTLFSAITETELVSGRANNNPRNKQLLMNMLLQFTKIPIDNPLAELAGDIRRQYSISLGDSVIAASALSHNATLITRNTKDFKKVPHLKIMEPY